MSNGKRHGDAGTRGRGDKRVVDAAALSLSPRPDSYASPLRVFCAVELPSEVRARAVEHITRLREAMPYARVSWERMEKLHITLKFLGEIAPNQIEALSDAASRA